jgi:hypothetical protein
MSRDVAQLARAYARNYTPLLGDRSPQTKIPRQRTLGKALRISYLPDGEFFS